MLAREQEIDNPSHVAPAYRQYYAAMEEILQQRIIKAQRSLRFGDWTPESSLPPITLASADENAELKFEPAKDKGKGKGKEKAEPKSEPPKDKDKDKADSEPEPEPEQPKKKGKNKDTRVAVPEPPTPKDDKDDGKVKDEAKPDPPKETPEPPKPEPPKGEPDAAKSESKPASKPQGKPGKSGTTPATSTVLPERPKTKPEPGEPQVKGPEGSQEKRAWAEVPKPKIKRRAKQEEPAAPPKRADNLELALPKFLEKHQERQAEIKREGERRLAAESAEKAKQRLLEIASLYKRPKDPMPLEQRRKAWGMFNLPEVPNEDAMGPFEVFLKSPEWVYQHCFGKHLVYLQHLEEVIPEPCMVWFDDGPNGHHTRLVVGLKDYRRLESHRVCLLLETWVALCWWTDSGRWDNPERVRDYRRAARRDVVAAVKRVCEAAERKARAPKPAPAKRVLEDERSRREKGAKADEARLREDVAGKLNTKQPPKNILLGVAAWLDNARSKFLSRDQIAELAKEEWCRRTAHLDEALARAHREEAESWFARVREPESDDEGEGKGKV
jgi:hypothetical protein